MNLALPNGGPDDASGGVVDARLTMTLDAGLRTGYRGKL